MSALKGDVAHFRWTPGTGAEAYQWQVTGSESLHLVPQTEAFVPSSVVGIGVPFQLRVHAVRLDQDEAVTEVGPPSLWSDVHAFVPEPSSLLLEAVAFVVLAFITARRKW